MRRYTQVGICFRGLQQLQPGVPKVKLQPADVCVSVHLSTGRSVTEAAMAYSLCSWGPGTRGRDQENKATHHRITEWLRLAGTSVPVWSVRPLCRAWICHRCFAMKHVLSAAILSACMPTYGNRQPFLLFLNGCRIKKFALNFLSSPNSDKIFRVAMGKSCDSSHLLLQNSLLIFLALWFCSPERMKSRFWGIVFLLMERHENYLVMNVPLSEITIMLEMR